MRSLPLAQIGGATLEVLGFNPQGFEWSGEANWASQPIFDGEPFYQPTGLNEETTTVSLAARPEIMGGLQNFTFLKAHWRKRDILPFLRLVGLTGHFLGMVGVRRLSSTEEKIGPRGIGRRWEFKAELLHVGQNAKELFQWSA